MNPSSQSPELNHARLPKGEILGMLSKRDAIVEFAVNQSLQLEQKRVVPSLASFLTAHENPAAVAQQRSQEAFQTNEYAGPQVQPYAIEAKPVAQGNEPLHQVGPQYKQAMAPKTAEPNILEESEVDAAAHARQVVDAIYADMHLKHADNPLFTSSEAAEEYPYAA